MARFETNSNYQKIPVEQIFFSTNVRWNAGQGGFDDDIADLAASIERNGLLQPIVVRPATEIDGVKKYEIIAGHRRMNAIYKLLSQGQDFSLVPCVIQSSGKLQTLQMIENIQRRDLTQKEKEAAIIEMLNSGMTQKQIAKELSKPISYVSDLLAGAKVRENAEAAGVDTKKVSTRALAQLRSIPKEKQAAATKELIKSGGTNRAATEILHKHKKEESPENSDPYSFVVLERKADARPADLAEKAMAETKKRPKFREGDFVAIQRLQIKVETEKELRRICDVRGFLEIGEAIDLLVELWQIKRSANFSLDEKAKK